MASELPETFVDVVKRQAHEKPDHAAFAFLGDISGNDIDMTVTFGDLHDEAVSIATWLGSHISPGDRVLLLFPSGLDFIKAFIGCLYAGAIAVPAPLPDGFRNQDERLSGILNDAAASVVLTDQKHLDTVEGALVETDGAFICAAISDVPTAAIRELNLPDIHPDTIAFLQYTSGSTGDPKGVMITHRNLMDNFRRIHQYVGGGPGMRVCGWLPVIHDMGLVGQVLFMIYLGGWCLLMPPTEFLRRPHRWLEIIDQFDIEATVAPNFAYELCVRVISEEKLRNLDLSRLRVAMNGAEPIHAETLEKFTARFAAAGFRREVFLPCYGMAEATLLVTGTPADAVPASVTVDPSALAAGELIPAEPTVVGRVLVSSGLADATRVKIVDPVTSHPLSDGRVGEVWVRGESVSQGYWRRDQLNKEAFGLRVAAEEGYHRTGDLGAVHHGQLYVTGRSKEVIIIRGRNLYPHDLERAISGLHPKLATGAVFSLPDHADHVVVVQEIRPHSLGEQDFRELTHSIKQTLVSRFGIPEPSVVLVRPGAVRKTTSGKIRRSLMRQLFLESSLTLVFEAYGRGFQAS
ncbi:fatty acyl-AMP ligase [Streptomyces sp. CG1]|uniref:fatty acyl-AMP ligase n=1 Tax=Streptomyces sp. CG1 TaxID=1287523 RepID=UPI0034E1AE28